MVQSQGLIKYFIFEQLTISYIREIWLNNRGQSKVFKVTFALFLRATHSFIFVDNA
jgi:hypothetical protein